MNKLVKAGIGIVVIGATLAIIFGINHRKNRETVEALQPGASVTAPCRFM